MTGREPTFLPLAVSAARTAANGSTAPTQRNDAQALRRHAETADRAAGECWTALLAGCDAPARRVLTFRLRDLTEAASIYVGAQCWFGATSPHRVRVAGAETQVAEAIRDGDGEEFVEALADYDQAVATALVSVRARPEDRAPEKPSRINTG
ncbi:MAG TPA: hypothetical protein VG317_11735 [Pseudonocardiaceae bacterium]|nr:hypothetical protein [Pseudonocardiaceae bacterium]